MAVLIFLIFLLALAAVKWRDRLDPAYQWLGWRLWGFGIAFDMQPEPDELFVWRFSVCLGPFVVLVDFR